MIAELRRKNQSGWGRIRGRELRVVEVEVEAVVVEVEVRLY